MRRHYFDRMNLGSGHFMKYPLWIDRTDYYFSKLPPPVPDSLAAMVEEVFQRLQPDTEAYQYYVGYVMNSLAKMSRYRTDSQEWCKDMGADFVVNHYHPKEELEKIGHP